MFVAKVAVSVIKIYDVYELGLRVNFVARAEVLFDQPSMRESWCP